MEIVQYIQLQKTHLNSSELHANIFTNRSVDIEPEHRSCEKDEKDRVFTIESIDIEREF